jgi:hypothetical protein
MNPNHNAVLQALGFTEGNIVETIMVTKNSDGIYNAAPMGVTYRDGFIEVHPYRSRSYLNLNHSNQASINITDDPLIFLKTAFKDELDFVPSVNDWVLMGSDATVFLEKLEEFNVSDLQAGFKFKPTRIAITKKEPMVFSRGRAEAIEAVIHATRVKVFQAESRYEKVDELLKRINDCFNVITRVSVAGSPEMQVVEELDKLIIKWGINR